MPAAHFCSGLTPSSLSSPPGCLHSHDSSIPMAGPMRPPLCAGAEPRTWLSRSCSVHRGELQGALLSSLLRGTCDPRWSVVAHGLGIVTPHCCAQALLQTLEGHSACSRRADTATVRKELVLLQLPGSLICAASERRFFSLGRCSVGFGVSISMTVPAGHGVSWW